MPPFRLALLTFTLAAATVHAGAPDGPAALDRHLAPLPEGAVARLGMWHETGGATGFTKRFLAVAPDGKKIATVHGRIVLVWDAASGKVLRRLTADPVAVIAIAFAPQDRLAVLGHAPGTGTGKVTIWDVATGTELRSWPVPANWAGTDFSPDGRLLATTSAHPPQPNRLRVRDLDTGKELFDAEEMYPSVFFSADGRHVLTVRYDRVRAGVYDTVLTVRDSRTGTVARRLVVPGRQITFTDLTPDGKMLAGYAFVPHAVQAEWSTRLQLFDATTGKEVRTLAEKLPIGDIGRARFSPDGKRVASVDRDSRVTVWDVASGKPVRSFPCADGYGNDLVFAPDGHALFNGGGHVSVYNLRTGSHRDLISRHQASVLTLAFAPDGKHLAAAGAGDPTIQVWDTASFNVVGRARVFDPAAPAGHPVLPEHLAFAPDGKHLLVRRSDARVSLFDPFAGTEIAPFRAAGTVYGFSADGRTLQWSGRPSPSNWRVMGGPRNPVPPNTVEPIESAVTWLAAALVHPELRQFRPLAYRAPKLAPPPEGTGLTFLDRVGQETTAPSFLSPDGRLLLERRLTLGGNPTSGMGTYWVDNGWRVVDARSGKPLGPFPRSPAGGVLAAPASGSSTPIAFAPDGRTVVTYAAAAERERGSLVEARGSERLRVKLGPVFAFSPDGRWLAGSDDKGGIGVIDLARGRLVHTLKPDSATRCLRFAPDSRRLASGHEGGTILFWDATRWPKGMPDPKAWTAAEGEELWAALAETDATRAYRAMIRLQGRPAEAVALLATRFDVPAAARIMQLIADLDGDDFARREAANRGLTALGEAARPFLEKAIGRPASLEHTRRVRGLLEQLGAPFTSPAGLRMLRSIEVLERLGTAEAVELLRRLAAGDDALAQEARRTLGRASARK